MVTEGKEKRKRNVSGRLIENLCRSNHKMKACCPSCRGSESSLRWSPVLLLHLHIACAEMNRQFQHDQPRAASMALYFGPLP